MQAAVLEDDRGLIFLFYCTPKYLTKIKKFYKGLCGMSREIKGPMLQPSEHLCSGGSGQEFW